MGKLDSGLRSRLESHPNDTVRAIVRVEGDLSEAARMLSAKGAKVAKRLQLINALVVTCRAKDIAVIARQGFVCSVEEDRAVRAQA